MDNDTQRFLALTNGAVASLAAKLAAAEAKVKDLGGDRDELREILHDLVMLDSEEFAIGGGPGFKERKEKAWRRARELFEP